MWSTYTYTRTHNHFSEASIQLYIVRTPCCTPSNSYHVYYRAAHESERFMYNAASKNAAAKSSHLQLITNFCTFTILHVFLYRYGYIVILSIVIQFMCNILLRLMHFRYGIFLFCKIALNVIDYISVVHCVGLIFRIFTASFYTYLLSV